MGTAQVRTEDREEKEKRLLHVQLAPLRVPHSGNTCGSATAAPWPSQPTRSWEPLPEELPRARLCLAPVTAGRCSWPRSVHCSMYPPLAAFLSQVCLLVFSY